VGTTGEKNLRFRSYVAIRNRHWQSPGRHHQKGFSQQRWSGGCARINEVRFQDELGDDALAARAGLAVHQRLVLCEQVGGGGQPALWQQRRRRRRHGGAAQWPSVCPPAPSCAVSWAEECGGPPGRSSQQNRPSKRSFWAPNLSKASNAGSDERQKGYFARLLDVPCNRLKKLPHLGLPAPLKASSQRDDSAVSFCLEATHTARESEWRMCLGVKISNSPLEPRMVTDETPVVPDTSTFPISTLFNLHFSQVLVSFVVSHEGV
jgi:hypothetical protein